MNRPSPLCRTFLPNRRWFGSVALPALGVLAATACAKKDPQPVTEDSIVISPIEDAKAAAAGVPTAYADPEVPFQGTYEGGPLDTWFSDRVVFAGPWMLSAPRDDRSLVVETRYVPTAESAQETTLLLSLVGRVSWDWMIAHVTPKPDGSLVVRSSDRGPATYRPVDSPPAIVLDPAAIDDEMPDIPSDSPRYPECMGHGSVMCGLVEEQALRTLAGCREQVTFACLSGPPIPEMSSASTPDEQFAFVVGLARLRVALLELGQRLSSGAGRTTADDARLLIRATAAETLRSLESLRPFLDAAPELAPRIEADPAFRRQAVLLAWAGGRGLATLEGPGWKLVSDIAAAESPGRSAPAGP